MSHAEDKNPTRKTLEIYNPRRHMWAEKKPKNTKPVNRFTVWAGVDSSVVAPVNSLDPICLSRRRQRENWFIFYTWSFFLPPLLLDVIFSVMTSGLTYFDIQSSLTILSLAIWLLHIHDLKHSLYFKISLSHFLSLYVLYDLSYMFHLVYATLLEMNLCVGHSHKEILTWSIFNSNTGKYFLSHFLFLALFVSHNIHNTIYLIKSC